MHVYVCACWHSMCARACAFAALVSAYQSYAGVCSSSLHVHAHMVQWLHVCTFAMWVHFVCVRTGLHLHLDSLRIHKPLNLATGKGIVGNVLVDPTAKIGSGCKIGPDVSVGAGCVIGSGVRLSNCVIMRGVTVNDYSKVHAIYIQRGTIRHAHSSADAS